MEKIKADGAHSRNVGRVMWESSFGLSLSHTPLQAHLTEQQRKHCVQRMPRVDLQKEYYSTAMKSTHLTQGMDSANFHAHIKQAKPCVPHPGDPDFILEHPDQKQAPCSGPTAAELVQQCPWAREESWEVPKAWDNGEHRGRAPGNKKELTQKIGYSPRCPASEVLNGHKQLKSFRSKSARVPRSQKGAETIQTILEEAQLEPVPSAPRTSTDFRSAEADILVMTQHTPPPSVHRRTTPRRMWRYDDREAVFTSAVGRSHFDVMNNLKPVKQRNGCMTPRGKFSRGDCGLEISPCPGMHESKPHPHQFLQTAPVLTSILTDV